MSETPPQNFQRIAATETVYVLPLKRGMWRAAKMTSMRYRRWKRAWDAWFAVKGNRLAISPEMWV